MSIQKPKDGSLIDLKIIFENDERVILHQFPLDQTVGALKDEVLLKWPTSLQKKPEGGRKQIRLIVMGRMLQDDNSKLQNAKVHLFDSVATPINVSVLPDDVLRKKESLKSAKCHRCAIS